MATAGSVCRSPYGLVRVRSALPEGADDVTHEAQVEAHPLHWRLANHKPPRIFIKRSDLVPAFTVNAAVECTFGKGVIRKIRADGVYEVDITSWTLANNTIPRAYLQAESITIASPAFAVGDEVATVFGEAVVNKVRWDGVFELKPKTWKLANNCTPVFYLQESAMKRTNRNKVEASVQESIERANTYKAEGNELFKGKQYQEAALSYLRALNVLRFVPEELKNSEKAQIIELSVPTHNNLASCYVRMQQPNDALAQATNALKILEAVDAVIPNGQVYLELLKRGVTDQKLKKDWRIKALFLIGKAMVMRGDAEYAIPVLSKAAELTGEPGNAEIRQLLENATKRMEKHKRDSKKLWSKAFQKRSAQVEPDPEEEAELAAKSAATSTETMPDETSPIKPSPLDAAAMSDLTAQIAKDLKQTKSFSMPKAAPGTPSAGAAKSDEWNSSSVAMLAVTAVGLLAAGAFIYLRGKK